MKQLQTTLVVVGFAVLAVYTDRSAQAEAKDNNKCAAQVSYRSDVDSAYKYLEEQQRQIYEQNPDLADPFAREEINSPRSVRSWSTLKTRAIQSCSVTEQRSKCALDPDLVDRLMKAIPCLDLPTRFEAPIFSSLISLYTDQLDKIRLKTFPSSGTTRFGSLPTGTFDAQAILPPRSKTFLVVLNRDIFFFTGALSKAVSDAIPIQTRASTVSLDSSEPGIQKRLRENAYIVRNFSDAMARLVKNGSSSGATEVTLDNNHNHLHARLVASMDRFIISHEQAHVILGHTNDQTAALHLAGAEKKKNNPISTERVTVPTSILSVQVRTRQQELEADALGFRLMMQSIDADDPISQMVGAAAPYMVFRILDAANRYGKEAGGWTFNDPNHPTLTERIEALSTAFSEVSKSVPALSQVDFRLPFDAAFNVLLAEADPVIREKLSLPNKAPN